MKSAKAVIKRNPKAAWQEVDNKIVVVTPGTRKIHILDGCASELWRSLAQEQTTQDLIQRICEDYDVAEPQARKDVLEFVAQSIEKDILSEPREQ